MSEEDPFLGRPWCYSKRTGGTEFDEMFRWADETEMDILCQGIMQGTREDPDDPEWHSVWSFGTEDEKLMFLLRFGSLDSCVEPC